MFLHLEDSLLMNLSSPVNISESHVIRVQDNLYHYLFDTYNKNIKPTISINSAVNVTFKLLLYQLLQIDEPHQSLTTNAWITETWTDQQLLWNPEDYGNISSLTVPYDIVWMPDTVLYNTLTMDDDDYRRLLNVRIHSVPQIGTSIVELMYPTILEISCKFNVRYFPFDTQNCSLVFGSWTYDSSDVNYYPDPQLNNESLKNLITNQEWEVLSLTSSRVVHEYSCCANVWVNVVYHLVIKRQPLYYVINLILPTSIIVTICMVGFFTPSSPSGERTEKVTLGITTLLALAILLLTVSDHLPTTSQYVAMIGWYFLSQIVLISMGTVVASSIICMQHRGKSGATMSPTVHTVVCILGRIVTMSHPTHCKTIQSRKFSESMSTSDEDKEKMLTERMLSWRTIKGEKLVNNSPKKSCINVASSDKSDRKKSVTYMEMANGGHVRRSSNRNRCRLDDDTESEISRESCYNYAANVIERITLLVFTSLSVMTCVFILFTGYYWV